MTTKPGLPLSSSGLGQDLGFLQRPQQQQQGRQPKQNGVISSLQGFAVPSSPPGPTREQQVQQQLQVIQQNTIKTHQSIIKPNSNGNNFGGRDPFSLPPGDAYPEDSVRTSRNPDFSGPGAFGTAATASYAVGNSYNNGGNGGGISSPSQEQLALFKPPPTLQYGFKPMTTPTVPDYPTPPPLTTQGRFSAPSSLMYGFSPLASTGSATSRPLVGGYTVEQQSFR